MKSGSQFRFPCSPNTWCEIMDEKTAKSIAQVYNLIVAGVIDRGDVKCEKCIIKIYRIKDIVRVDIPINK